MVPLFLLPSAGPYYMEARYYRGGERPDKNETAAL